MTIPSKVKAKRQSEFGKGLVICLVKFAEHAEKWRETKILYSDLSKKNKDTFSEHSAVEMFFNGASDHLYEIQVPKQWKDTVR